MSTLVAAALAFASEAHASINQRRKFTWEPYIVHPIAVAALVQSVDHDEAMIAAALLHDVVEDVAPLRPAYDRSAIFARFGEDVAELVGWLTDVAGRADGDRSARVARNRAHSAAASARAQTIKVADVIDNTRTVLERDPHGVPHYLAEKAALLDVLVQADPVLLALARQQVELNRSSTAR